MKEKKVRVGILTDGFPRLAKRREEGDATSGVRVLNAQMGRGFHWQRTYVMTLPPDAEVVDTDPLVVEVPVETYLRSVVASEMSSDAPAEFLKAHAVVSRSWVAGKLRHAGTHQGASGNTLFPAEIRTWEDTEAHTGFHVCNDDHCQRFQGLQPIASEVAKALHDTEGLILVDAEGRVADARFSKCCGGRTELFSTCWQDRDFPYLTSIEDPWCDPAAMPEGLLRKALKGYDADTPFYRWTRDVRGADIARRLLERFGKRVGQITGLEAAERGPSGRIHRLRIAGTEGEVTVGKELTIRRLLDENCLPSSAFTAAPLGDGRFRLHGRGWGHGVGMCQIGAAHMADAGHDFREILAFYYPNTQLVKLY